MESATLNGGDSGTIRPIQIYVLYASETGNCESIFMRFLRLHQSNLEGDQQS